jgi:3-methyladenine DNA glycosylase AlkD
MDTAHLIPPLQARLDALATDKSRSFWQGYMKGAVPFRGVPMAAIRGAVHAWWRHDGPAMLPTACQKQLAISLFEGRYGEDKLAGTLALQELLLPDLTPPDLERLGALFERGLIADWNTCDWLCVKVLGRWVARDLPNRSTGEAIVGWRGARTVWQRRAANVAFVNLAKRGEHNFGGFTGLMLQTCAVTVQSSERFAQTGVGWLLRELAHTQQAAVVDFLRCHLGQMSREGLRYAVERMPAAERAVLLEAHGSLQRTTSTRRPATAP